MQNSNFRLAAALAASAAFLASCGDRDCRDAQGRVVGCHGGAGGHGGAFFGGGAHGTGDDAGVARGGFGGTGDGGGHGGGGE